MQWRVNLEYVKFIIAYGMIHASTEVRSRWICFAIWNLLRLHKLLGQANCMFLSCTRNVAKIVTISTSGMLNKPTFLKLPCGELFSSSSVASRASPCVWWMIRRKWQSSVRFNWQQYLDLFLRNFPIVGFNLRFRISSSTIHISRRLNIAVDIYYN